MAGGVSVRGIEAVVAELERRAARLAQAVADGVNETAIAIQADAKRAAPVDTGRMRAGIAFDPADAGTPVAQVTATAEYSEHVEFGTSTQPAQPFMTPAYLAQAPQLKARIARHAKRHT